MFVKLNRKCRIRLLHDSGSISENDRISLIDDCEELLNIIAKPQNAVKDKMRDS